MGSVYLAEDDRLVRSVALKRMHSDLGSGMAERFRREARLGASLSHPNVVRVFDVFEEDDGVTTLVLEYVEGETLADVLRRGAMPPEQAVVLLESLAKALDHAHQNGVVHRDIKPPNVLIGRDGSVKLADLGVATGADLTRVTSTGTALGSASYMAPEQLAGEHVGPAADVYALAAVAFEALTGRRARTGDSPMAIVHQVANEPPPDLGIAWPEAPPGATAVLEQGMAFLPEDRPESATRLVRDLEEGLRPILDKRQPPAVEDQPRAVDDQPAAIADRPPVVQDQPPAGEESQRPERRRRRAAGLVAGVFALLAVVAGVVSVALLSGDQGKEPRARQENSATSPSPSPDVVVRSFYTRAADDRFRSAWALAGPGVRSQLGGFEAFRRQLAPVQSITFAQARVTSRAGDAATVAIVTRAVHPDKVDNCRGDVSLERSEGRWLIQRLGVACS